MLYAVWECRKLASSWGTAAQVPSDRPITARIGSCMTGSRAGRAEQCECFKRNTLMIEGSARAIDTGTPGTVARHVTVDDCARGLPCVDPKGGSKLGVQRE